jgi:predicted Zn-dependent protease
MIGKRLHAKLRCAAPLLLGGLLSACAQTPVTGRNQFMVISEEQAISMSESAYGEMLKEPAGQGKLDNDARLKQRVDTITARIIAQAINFRPETASWKWSIHIIDDPNIVNAWAMAGGRMALYTGLVEKIKPTDDELAQVLGHEISHALAKHTAEKMSIALATNMAVSIFAKGDENAAKVASVAIELPNSRTAESEADRIGIELAARAGYNPNAAVTLWTKMAQLGGGKSIEFLSTHPAPKTRINELRKLAPQMMPYYQQKGERPIYRFKPEASKLSAR